MTFPGLKSKFSSEYQIRVRENMISVFLSVTQAYSEKEFRVLQLGVDHLVTSLDAKTPFTSRKGNPSARFTMARGLS